MHAPAIDVVPLLTPRSHRLPSAARWPLAGPLVFAWLTLTAVASAASAATERNAAPAADDPVQVNVKASGSVLSVTFNVDVAAPAATCYQVLADLDHLAEFVPSMLSSHIVSEPGAPVEVRQVGRTRVGFLKFDLDVTLAVTLDAPREITFRRVAGNLRQMRGRWTIGGDGTTCAIGYEAVIEPDFWVPPLIGPMLMRQQIESQIDSIVLEIHRRVRTGS